MVDVIDTKLKPKTKPKPKSKSKPRPDLKVENKRPAGSLNRDEVIGKFIDKKEVDDIEDNKTMKHYALEKSFDNMLSVEDMKLKTELSKNLALEFSRAQVMLSIVKIPALQSLVDNYELYAVSIKRQGRTELVKITTNAVNFEEPMEPTLLQKGIERLI